MLIDGQTAECGTRSCVERLLVSDRYLVPACDGVQRSRTDTPASGKHLRAVRPETRDAESCHSGTCKNGDPVAFIRADAGSVHLPA
jgi:hypothetical protein